MITLGKLTGITKADQLAYWREKRDAAEKADHHLAYVHAFIGVHNLERASMGGDEGCHIVLSGIAPAYENAFPERRALVDFASMMRAGNLRLRGNKLLEAGHRENATT